MIKLAWHYTTGDAFLEIVKSGFLITTSEHCPQHERPVLWFSMNQRWEPTAAKGIVENFQRRTASMQENKELGNGLVRFGYPHSKLIPWVELWKQVGILPAQKRGLEKAGREQGANPYHWYGCFHEIPVDQLVVEVMNDFDQWERVHATTQKDAA